MKIVKTEVFHLTEEKNTAFLNTLELVNELYEKSEADGDFETACAEAKDALTKLYRFYRGG